MARGKETEFTNYFKKTLQSLGGYGYKIPDEASGGKFRLARPFDFVGVLEGIPLAIEFKFNKEPKSINQKTLSENQHDGLRQFEEAGGLALVGLFVKVARGEYRLFLWKYSEFRYLDYGRFGARAQKVLDYYIPFITSDQVFDEVRLAATLETKMFGFGRGLTQKAKRAQHKRLSGG